MSWTDERVEKLKAMWAEGMTASRISRELGGVSRNAVIGKVHRLGLSNRGPAGKELGMDSDASDASKSKRKAGGQAAAPDAPAEAPVEKTSKKSERPKLTTVEGGAGKAPAKAPEAEAAPDEAVIEAAPAEENPVTKLAAEAEKSARKLTLLELNERTCKWPIGDPSTDDFYFCGLPCAPDKPYCEAHVAVAYQPMSSRRERDLSRRRSNSA